jgi:hypothetical protein
MNIHLRTYSLRSFQHDLMREQICRRREQRKLGGPETATPCGVHLVRVCVEVHYVPHATPLFPKNDEYQQFACSHGSKRCRNPAD